MLDELQAGAGAMVTGAIKRPSLSQSHFKAKWADPLDSREAEAQRLLLWRARAKCEDADVPPWSLYVGSLCESAAGASAGADGFCMDMLRL